MARKRLTQLFPFLLPVRRWQRRRFFYAKMFFDRNRYAKRRLTETLPHLICSVSGGLINKRSGFPIEYQLNKAHNLALAAKTIQHILIYPGQTFSFYQLVKKADRHERFKDGLILQNGELKPSYGGGLCQLSSLLFQLFLRSPLKITERHAHARETLPPITPGEPAGMDAAVSEGWQDLKAYNPTQAVFQLELELDGQYIYGRLFSDSPSQYEYTPFNSALKYLRKDGKLYRHAEISRNITDKNTLESQNELLYSEICEICYPEEYIPQNLIKEETA